MAIADSHSLRKCAILLSSVDADAARQLLMQLPTESAQQVRRVAASLDDVEPAERQAVLHEFHQAALAGGLAPNAGTGYPQPMPASSRLAGPVGGAARTEQPAPSETHLENTWPAAQAFPIADPSAIDLDAELTKERVAGPTGLSESAEVAGRDVVPKVALNAQAERERSTNGRIRDLDDLLALPRELLAQVMNGCDSETVLLALAGASPQFIERFYGMLQPPDARDLDRRLKSISGLKLSDIDQAQIRLVEAAEQLLRSQRKSA